MVISFESLSVFESDSLACDLVLLSGAEDKGFSVTPIESLGDVEKFPDHIIGVLSARNLSYFVLDVPEKQHRYLSKTLPYMLEDDLLSPLDALHISYTISSDNNIRAAVINRQALDRLLALLDQKGIQLNKLYVDTDLLTYDRSQQIVIDKSKELFIRDDRLITCVDNKSIAGQIDISGSVENLFASPAIISVHSVFNPPSSAVNLLQGKYAQAPKGFSKKSLVALISILLVLLFLQIGYWFFAGLTYSHKSEINFSESEKIYLDLFPSDVIVDVRSQAEGHLLSRVGQGNQDLLAILVHVGQVLIEMDAADNYVKSVHYDSRRGQTDLDISLALIAEAETITEKLQLTGYNVELLQVTRNTDARVSARLRITAL